jgi:repressor of nif and glnA expression
MRLSEKQIELLKIIREKNPDGAAIDLDQIIERTSYKPTKEAIQFSIRALIKRGLIEKLGTEVRRGSRRVTFGLTETGGFYAPPLSKRSPIVSTVDEDEVLEAIESI